MYISIVYLIAKIIVYYVIAIFIFLGVALSIKKSCEKLSNNAKFDNVILFILKVGLIYPIMLLANVYFPLVIILIMILEFIFWLSVIIILGKTLGMAYFVLTLSSVVFAYANSKLIKKLFSLNVKAFNMEYMEDVKSKYSKYLIADLSRVVTYAILLGIYLYKNYSTFNDGTPNSIIAVSSEALLTFVIIDTIIQIFKNLKVHKIKEKD